MKLQTNIAKTSLLTAAMFAAGAFVALAQSQQAHAQTQHFYIGSGGGTDAVTASPGGKTNYDVYFNETDGIGDGSDADANASTVVSVMIHYDSAVFSSPVVTDLAAVADFDSGACLLSDGTQPPDVAAAAANLQISGASAGDEDATGSITVGSANAVATDKIVSVTFAQICGPVFAGTGERKLFNVEFDVAEFTGSTAIGFAAANGGDFVVSNVEDVEATVTPQTFTLDVDLSGRVNAADATMITRYLANFRGARLTALQTSADAADVQAAIAEGVTSVVLDVDVSGRVNAADATMITRYLANFRGARLTALQTSADAADVQAAISALIP